VIRPFKPNCGLLTGVEHRQWRHEPFHGRREGLIAAQCRRKSSADMRELGIKATHKGEHVYLMKGRLKEIEASAG
jgi:hypothetical protein